MTGVPLLLARHGETRDNASGLILGRRDPPLSQVGRGQAQQLAAAAVAAEVAEVWCSPLLRARQTAAIVGDAIGARPIVLDDLIESDRGAWEGQSVAHLAKISPQLHAAFEAGDPAFVFPGGESLLQQAQRTRRALTVVAAGPGPALVVAHAGTIRGALVALGQPPPPERALPHGRMIPLTWPAGEAPRVPDRPVPAGPTPPAPLRDG